MCLLSFTDYDECADQNYDCPADSHCVNVFDGYDCRCNKGFFLNANKKCEGISILTMTNRISQSTVSWYFQPLGRLFPHLTLEKKMRNQTVWYLE